MPIVRKQAGDARRWQRARALRRGHCAPHAHRVARSRRIPRCAPAVEVHHVRHQRRDAEPCGVRVRAPIGYWIAWAAAVPAVPNASPARVRRASSARAPRDPRRRPRPAGRLRPIRVDRLQRRHVAERFLPTNTRSRREGGVAVRRTAVKASIAWVSASAPAMRGQPRRAGQGEFGIADRSVGNEVRAGDADLGHRAAGSASTATGVTSEPVPDVVGYADQRQDRTRHLELAVIDRASAPDASTPSATSLAMSMQLPPPMPITTSGAKVACDAVASSRQVERQFGKRAVIDMDGEARLGRSSTMSRQHRIAASARRCRGRRARRATGATPGSARRWPLPKTSAGAANGSRRKSCRPLHRWLRLRCDRRFQPVAEVVGGMDNPWRGRRCRVPVRAVAGDQTPP